MLIKIDPKKETAHDFYGADGPIRNFRYGFHRTNRTGIIGKYCCEKCVYGSGEHANFCTTFSSSNKEKEKLSPPTE